VQERLEREFDLSLILTAPSVSYEIDLKDGATQRIDNPALYPDPTLIERTREPFIRATIIVPERYMGAVMKLCLDRRGINKNYQYLTSDRLEMIFELPLSEVVYDFYDRQTIHGQAALGHQTVARLHRLIGLNRADDERHQDAGAHPDDGDDDDQFHQRETVSRVWSLPAHQKFNR